jgi:hypothetical protein
VLLGGRRQQTARRGEISEAVVDQQEPASVAPDFNSPALGIGDAPAGLRLPMAPVRAYDADPEAMGHQNSS